MAELQLPVNIQLRPRRFTLPDLADFQGNAEQISAAKNTMLSYLKTFGFAA
jgi:hypothetical protein